MFDNIWIVFRVSDKMLALPRECIRRILPIPALSRPPGIPLAIEGLFEFSGSVTPAIRLDRLFGLTPAALHPYQHLLLLNLAPPPAALLVDRATDILRITPESLTPVLSGETFNDCVIALFTRADSTQIHLLSPERLLSEHEKLALADFLAIQQRRFSEWEIPA